MQHTIGINILDVLNQLFFTYKGLVPELQVFIISSTKAIKALDFI